MTPIDGKNGRSWLPRAAEAMRLWASSQRAPSWSRGARSSKQGPARADGSAKPSKVRAHQLSIA
jgi:hypothetical protein